MKRRIFVKDILERDPCISPVGIIPAEGLTPRQLLRFEHTAVNKTDIMWCFDFCGRSVVFTPDEVVDLEHAWYSQTIAECSLWRATQEPDSSGRPPVNTPDPFPFVLNFIRTLENRKKGTPSK